MKTSDNKLNNMDIRNCTCRICTCGKHKCLTTPSKTNPYHYETVQRASYQNPLDSSELGNRTPRASSKYYIKNYDPNVLVSTYRSDYTPQKISGPPKKQKDLDIPIFPNFDFDGESSYKSDYQKKKLIIQPYIQEKQQYRKSPYTFFQKTSIYKEDFVTHKLPEKDRYIPQPNLLKTPSFNPNTTTYQNNYQEFSRDPVIKKRSTTPLYMPVPSFQLRRQFI